MPFEAYTIDGKRVMVKEPKSEYLCHDARDAQKLGILKNIINYLVDMKGRTVALEEIEEQAMIIKMKDWDFYVEQLKRQGLIMEQRKGFVEII